VRWLGVSCRARLARMTRRALAGVFGALAARLVRQDRTQAP
jgi:hypothetical protein